MLQSSGVLNPIGNKEYKWLKLPFLMDPKTESHYHLAFLACTNTNKVGTPSHHKELRNLLENYGSFESMFSELNLSMSTKVEDELRLAEKYLDKLKFDFNMTTINDSDFPTKLKNIQGTSPVLYYRGDLSLAEKDSMAVIGTRESLISTELENAKYVVRGILKRGYAVVSGLASGCDTLGHEIAVDSGKTVAVLGTPLNKYYPKENRDLQERIAEEHLLVSQYPIGLDRFQYYKTQGQNFAKRNQTTVALANKGILVIKTADKGGTQNAIKVASKWNVPIYVMESNFNSGYSWIDDFEWEKHSVVRKAK